MNRFKRVKNGYLDSKTNLIWSEKTYPKMNWKDAVKLKNKKWRLPTIKELLSIVDYSLFNPCTELPNMNSSNYWSTSSYSTHSSNAWIVDFLDGHSDNYYKGYGYYVRLVRKGRGIKDG